MNSPDPAWWPLLWNSGTVALAELGPDRRYRAVNEACCRMLETDAADLLTWSYERIGHPLDIDRELDAWVRLADGAPAVSYVRRFRTARAHELTATVQAIQGTADCILQVIVPGAIAPATADPAAKRLEQLAAALSHDAQEPVRQLGVSAGILTDRLESLFSAHERERSLLQGMEHHAVRLNRQLRGLTRFARLRAPVVDPTPHSVRHLVDQALAQLTIPPRIVLHDTVTAGETLRCDAPQIIEALGELLRNALAAHAVDRPTRITIGCTFDEQRCTITVADDNVGIAASDLPSLGRLLASRGPGAGVGIGLALVRSIVEGHGGDVRLESTPGIGTVAHLSLPR